MSACTIKKPIFFLDIFFNPHLIDVDIPFKYSMIKSLKRIRGDRGAKKLIRSNKSKIKLMKMKSKSILIDFDQLKDFPSAT